ncbi:MAG: hypothetical protein EP340_04450 [Alphaproteobacteria bacterium]|nr:MAG: hypothetical protein EP340_04450 [Alphaproteobacteria bacterium]
MKLGLFLSALFHLAAVLAGMVVLPAKWADQERFEVIPIELLTIADETNVIAKSEEVKEEPQEAPKEEKLFAEAAPAPEVEQKVVPEDAMPALPKDKPEEKKPEPKAEEKPKPQPDRAAKARPRHKPKPPADTSDFSFDDIEKSLKQTALLDKKPTEEEQKPSDFESAMEDFFGSELDQDRQKVGAGNDLTMSEVDYLKNAIASCWRPPAGAANPEELIVDLKIYFNRDGSLAAAPEVTRSGTSTFYKNTFAQAAESAALRAVEKCAPYDQLPESKYERWRVVTFTFDPSSMVGQ